MARARGHDNEESSVPVTRVADTNLIPQRSFDSWFEAAPAVERDCEHLLPLAKPGLRVRSRRAVCAIRCLGQFVERVGKALQRPRRMCRYGHGISRIVCLDIRNRHQLRL